MFDITLICKKDIHTIEIYNNKEEGHRVVRASAALGVFMAMRNVYSKFEFDLAQVTSLEDHKGTLVVGSSVKLPERIMHMFEDAWEYFNEYHVINVKPGSLNEW